MVLKPLNNPTTQKGYWLYKQPQSKIGFFYLEINPGFTSVSSFRCCCDGSLLLRFILYCWYFCCCRLDFFSSPILFLAILPKIKKIHSFVVWDKKKLQINGNKERDFKWTLSIPGVQKYLLAENFLKSFLSFSLYFLLETWRLFREKFLSGIYGNSFEVLSSTWADE